MIARLSFAMAVMACCGGWLSAAPQSPGDESADIDLLINARAQLRDAKVEQAEQTTRDYLRKHVASGQGHFLLGFILFKEAQGKAEVEQTQEKARLSLAEFTEGAKTRLPSSLDFKVVALDYVLFGDFPDADKWLTHSLTTNPRDPEAWYYLGRIKSSEKKLPEAVQAFDQCLKLDPQYAQAEQAKRKVLASEAAPH